MEWKTTMKTFDWIILTKHQKRFVLPHFGRTTQC
jgi:hypothetical protein